MADANEERGACWSALLRGLASRLVEASPLGLGGPGRLILDLHEDFERFADCLSEPAEDSGHRDIEVLARRLIPAVVNRVHHGDHPFLLLAASECQRKCVDAVVRDLE